MNRIILAMSLFPLIAVMGCGGSSGSSGQSDGGSDLSGVPSGSDLAHADNSDLAPADMTPNNPPNPAGLGPAPVNTGTVGSLAASGSYVILAKTGVTNVTGSLITGGSVGLSPAAASFITGFSMTADSTNVFATSASVVPPAKIYAADYASPTPANLTAAVLSMQTAYADAASRSPADHLNLSSGNLGGLTLAPGLYTWGSAVTIPTDVTLSGGANDVWIFQVSNDLDISSAKQVVLSGGALAKNVFWQVAGNVTIEANAQFSGVILCKTAIAMQTNATLHGRMLAQTMVALDNNAVTAP
jgi:Ice-binding-like